MQKIDEIRHVFSKGSVCLSDEGIMVFYTYRESWFTDEIKGNNKMVFERLIGNCGSFGVQYIPGKFIKIIFIFDGISDKLVFYKPIDKHIPLEDVETFMREYELSKEFVDFVTEESLNEDDIIGRITEWVMLKNSEYLDSVKMKSITSWEGFCNLTQEIVNYCGGEAELIAPAIGNDGSCELRFPEGISDVIWFDGESKRVFLKLVMLSELVTIEGNVTNGFLNIGFYL